MSDENVYTSQGHPNLKEIGSPQTKQCNAYCKKSKEKKRAANNEQNNEQQNEQNRKNKKPSRLSNLDVSEFMIEIISKVKPRNWWTENSREKRSTNFLLNKNIEMTYLKIPRQWSLQAKKCLSVLINQLFASVLPLLT